MRFYDREKEISILKNIKKDFRIAIIGRRRIGKTTLVEHFYRPACLTFFVPAEKAEKEIIGDWVREYEKLHLPNVSTFKEFFEFVFFHAKDRVIFIDEAQNFLKVNKSFIFDLQRLIDKHKPRLIITGSLISVMKKIVEDYKSPLYGRFDFIIKLKELELRTICEICRDFKLNFETAFKLYSVFGGIPKYYELIEKLDKFKFEEFVLDFFVRYPRPLYEEVRTMLKEEFGKEHKTFFSILSAISQGNNRHSEIAGYLGKKQTDISKYLSLLKQDFELIKLEVPVIGGKRGIYSIKNNIVCFWFKNIWRYSQLLETGQEDKIIGIVRKDLNKFISLRFETMITELVSLNQLKLPLKFTKVGKQWGKFKGEKGKNTYEIDIVALNEGTKEILFCECKWQEKVNAKQILNQLAEKTKYVDWNNGQRKKYYAVFAKSFVQKIKEWDGKKVFCFDLMDLEKAIKS